MSDKNCGLDPKKKSDTPKKHSVFSKFRFYIFIFESRNFAYVRPDIYSFLFKINFGNNYFISR